MLIKINIANRKATLQDAPVLVCGNFTDQVEFAFDEEWNKYTAKTARFVYVRVGEVIFQDVPFTGNTANIPPLANITEVRVGVFAEDIITTTPAVVPCEKSIKCGTGKPEAPTSDVYAEIMRLFNATYIDPSLTPVDQTFDPESENPQSGKALKEKFASLENGGVAEERIEVLEFEVFEEQVTTDTTEGISPDVVLEWTEGYCYSINGGIYTTSAQYNSTQKFETTVFPKITRPELLTETAGSLVAFWNNDVYAGYWSNGQYYNDSKVVVDTLTFTHAAFSIRSATDYTQIELVYAEVIETVTKISKIQDVRERTTALEYKTGVLETKVQALENGGASGGSGNSGDGDTSRQGKKYYLFGDSITYWDSRASWYDDTVYMVAYPSYIRDVLQAEIVNCGVAGNKAENITARLKTTNLTDAYAVTYMSGANDLNNNVPIGTIGEFDTTTYIGSIETAIKYVAENYPHVKFYLLSPLFTTYGDIKPYAEAMQSVADHYSIPILRWDKVSQINQFNSNYYTVEGIHPNNLGHALMADSLLPFLRNH
jgi:lysophospholipase L1-like esterase